MKTLALIAALAIPAAADPPVASSEKPTPPPPEPRAPASAHPTPEPTAADVAGMPEPGDESGRTDAGDGGDGVMRRIGRGLLFFPKLAVDAVLMPVRGLVWVQDQYHLDDKYYSLFYNRDRTFGLYPTATYESGYGLAVGARATAHDYLGHDEQLAVQASTGRLYGETYRDSLLGSLRTGKLLGPLELGLDGSFDRRPNDPYYGLGNNDGTVMGHYRYQEKRVAASTDVGVTRWLHVRASGAVTELTLSDSTQDVPIEMEFPPNELTGFPTIQHLYGEMELRLDTRHASRFEPRNMHAEGWLADVYAGRIHRLDDGPDYWRYGAELQRYWRITSGPRILVARAHFEAVTGSRDEVPFVELPALGGGELLRGYDFLRFRDRVAALTTAQYIWDLNHFLDAELFVDAGRVYGSVDDMTLAGLRVGYGVGLEIHNDSSFIVETSLASSIDGGIFFSLSFNPVLDARPRWR